MEPKSEEILKVTSVLGLILFHCFHSSVKIKLTMLQIAKYSNVFYLSAGAATAMYCFPFFIQRTLHIALSWVAFLYNAKGLCFAENLRRFLPLLRFYIIAYHCGGSSHHTIIFTRSRLQKSFFIEGVILMFL